MDKHHPLEAYFMSWENSEEQLKEIVELEIIGSTSEKDSRELITQLQDGTISLQAISTIKDLSDSEHTKTLLESAKNAIKLLAAMKNTSKDKFSSVKPEIDVLNRFLNLIEVDSGLLVCPVCQRWYPIGCAVEAIPELMPDELREKERELKWMEKWRDLIPQKVLEAGKPFNLSS
jgi:uncharacterized protein YbaR (Trm112 family)